MRREFLSLLSAAALAILFVSPSARAQSTTGSIQTHVSKQAQIHSRSTHINQAQAQKAASRMVPARAYLKQTIDAQKVHKGQKIRATLAENVQLKNGPKLPRGTTLVGQVTQDKRQAHSARLALRFTQAKLHNGKMIPIKAMIVSISQPRQAAIDGNQGAVPVAELWNGHTYQVDQVGAEPGASLHSTITSKNSAVLSSHKRNNVWIAQGSRMGLAIGTRGHAQQRGQQSDKQPSL